MRVFWASAKRALCAQAAYFPKDMPKSRGWRTCWRLQRAADGRARAGKRFQKTAVAGERPVNGGVAQTAPAELAPDVEVRPRGCRISLPDPDHVDRATDR